jgi:hypothetical protein
MLYFMYLTYYLKYQFDKQQQTFIKNKIFQENIIYVNVHDRYK